MRAPNATVLILTPMKTASRYLEGYFKRLETLTYPHNLISLGILEGDSSDDTFSQLQRRLPASCKDFRSKHVFKKDFGLIMPRDVPRFEPVYQPQRRAVLAKSRNHLLFRALRNEDWVLWLDVDVVEFPADILQQLIALDLDIVTPTASQSMAVGPSTSTPGATTAACTWITCAAADGYVSIRSVGRCCWCGPTGIVTDLCSRLSSTVDEVAGYARQILGGESTSAKSKPKVSP